MNRHTYNMGVVGNCSYLSLIDQSADVRWMCWPNFDSSFIFGSLLDDERGGEFSVKPYGEDFTTSQAYLPNTNVLRTEFDTPSGRYAVTDYAPRFDQYERSYKPLMLIRKLEPLAGLPRIRVVCSPVGEYGALTPNEYPGSNHIQFIGLERPVRLTTDVPLNYVQHQLPFLLTEPRYLVLTWGLPLEAPLQQTAETFLRRTINYWEDWVRQCQIPALWQEQTIRSALALKVHQYEDTGAIIASATTSLPEADGSGRNWDYRYCWMRDTYYTLKAFNDIGHFDELEKYAGYVQNIALTAQNGRYRPVYSILGMGDFKEKSLDLAGYLGRNQPVRVGNQAREHVQNDVYGQILVSLLPLYVDKRLSHEDRSHTGQLVMEILGMIEATMDEPDAGLWEFRHFAQRHCYTFLFHWAGSCAALKMARHLRNDAMAQKAEALRQRAIAQIEACYRPAQNAYAQAIETNNLDASLLQLITMGYLDPRSDRAQAHLQALEKGLRTPEGLFYRYRHADDFGEPETTFLVCAFWYVDALACANRVDDAIETLEGLLRYTNHLGLLSEDVDAATGSQWGNFPQTYSHVGLINAVIRISNKLDRPLFL